MSEKTQAAADDAAPSDRPDEPIKVWCKRRGYSVATFYKMQSKGYAPETFCIPGTRIVRISPKADREWEKRIEAMQASDEVRRERQLRADAARRAGERAAKSDKHVCRTRALRNAKKRRA